jgi:hypothetical protein
VEVEHFPWLKHVIVFRTANFNNAKSLLFGNCFRMVNFFFLFNLRFRKMKKKELVMMNKTVIRIKLRWSC